MCDGGKFASRNCEYDAGDCDEFRVAFPNCPLDEIANLMSLENIPVLGDGVCESSLYNNEDCGYERGDCTECNNAVSDEWLTGDGVCHGGFHNSQICNFDAGDCAEFNEAYPRCQVDAQAKLINSTLFFVPIIGDGICNSGLYNNPDCGYEDGDCLLCNELIDDISKIGDGVCDGQNYMSNACGLDGGDCAKCPFARFEM